MRGAQKETGTNAPTAIAVAAGLEEVCERQIGRKQQQRDRRHSSSDEQHTDTQSRRRGPERDRDSTTGTAASDHFTAAARSAAAGRLVYGLRHGMACIIILVYRIYK